MPFYINENAPAHDTLVSVKTALGISGDYHDETLKIYIDEVKSFMFFAGINEDVVNGTIARGVICRGVADLWNYGAGNTQFSEYFKQRVTQLALGCKGGGE